MNDERDEIEERDPMRSRARLTDPLTSHEAAASVDNSAVDSKIMPRLHALVEIGATTLELSDDLQLPRVTVSPRMVILEKAGKVFRFDDIKRVGHTGRRSEVWFSIRACATFIDLLGPLGRKKNRSA